MILSLRRLNPPTRKMSLSKTPYREVLQRRKRRRFTRDTDNEVMDSFQSQPFKDDVKDEDFESDFEEAHSIDDELEHMCNSPEYVKKKMKNNKFF
ncbi:hypothetical protein Bca4012_057877 [Brassica carinata]|uniref:Uncharacterized protein n=1 Tax=Brassica carinata TaxID=52824 RepID=A0A8X7TUR7_BRACI|nr:hypothetical protein Bca52824_084417 [Brassica carinata]